MQAGILYRTTALFKTKQQRSAPCRKAPGRYRAGEHTRPHHTAPLQPRRAEAALTQHRSRRPRHFIFPAPRQIYGRDRSLLAVLQVRCASRALAFPQTLNLKEGLSGQADPRL